jgi:hypothetical protein
MGNGYHTEMPWDEPDRDQLLATYLNDHLMGASAGVDLFKRVAGGYSDHATRGLLSELADEVADDRDSLLVIMAQLDIKPQTHRMIAGRLVEKVGRLKMNGTVLKRSPLTDLIELEGLRIGVEGKLAMWRALQAGLHDDRVVPSEIDELIQRAEHQIERLEAIRLTAAQRVFAAPPS